jgi:hypothetical protein
MQGRPASGPTERIVFSDRVLGTLAILKRLPLNDWGWSPTFAVVAALGLLIVSIGDNRSQLSQPGGYAMFWIGVLIIFVPIAIRLSMAGLSRTETVTLLAILAFTLYLVKVLHSPYYFTFPDEFFHWRTTDDIIQTGRMFATNPLLPVSARYPGLEGTTSAVVELGGISIFSAGLIVAGTARLLLLLSLFLIFERLIPSRRVAGVATALYMTNANFLFFNASYKYETFALGLAAIALFLIILWTRATGADRWRLAILSVLACAATAASHHITAVALGGVLVAWTAASAWLQRRGHAQRSPWPMMLASIGITLLWFVFVAPITAPYLAPVVTKAATAPFELVGSRLGLFSGTEPGRELFATPQGVIPAPAWERFDALGAAVIVLIAVGVGVWRAIRNYGRLPLTLAFAVIAAGYPASLLLRLTRHGWETANRSSEFLYVAVGLLAALGVVVLSNGVKWPAARLFLSGAVAGVLLVGGVFSGWPYAWRLPGPYLPGGGPLAVTDEGIRASNWARQHFATDTRIGADAANHVLLGSYGRVFVMTTSSGGIDPNWVILAPAIDHDKVDYLRQGRVDYLVVDSRLALQPDLLDKYFPGASPMLALEKFDRLGLERIYDSGDITVYDVRDVWQPT